MALHNEKEDQRRFQAESDVRTLVEAARINKDKKRMTAAKKSLSEQRAALGSEHKSKHED